MADTISQIVWETFYPAFGSPLLFFGFAIVFLVFLFVVTKQNLATSMLLGMVAIDSLDRMANLQYISVLNIVLKIIIFGIIGYAIAQKQRD